MNNRQRQQNKARSMCIAFAEWKRFKAALLQTIEEDAKYWMLMYAEVAAARKEDTMNRTYEEIKKVLAECDEGYACKKINCPYDDGLCLYVQSNCLTALRKDALDLINELERDVNAAYDH